MIRNLKDFIWKLTNDNNSAEYTIRLLAGLERRIYNASVGCRITDDFAEFQMNVLYYGQNLLDIQRYFGMIDINPFSTELVNRHRNTKDMISDGIHTYAEYIEFIQEGKIPGHIKIPVDVEVKFDIDTYIHPEFDPEMGIDGPIYKGTVQLNVDEHAISSNDMSILLGHVADGFIATQKTTGFFTTCLKAGTYIPNPESAVSVSQNKIQIYAP